MKKKLLLCILASTLVIGGCGASETPDEGTNRETDVTQEQNKDEVPDQDSDDLAKQPEEEPDKKKSDSKENEEDSESIASENPLLASEFKIDDVMNGSKTEVIGQYAYIKISKSELKTISEEQFREFADKKVKDSGYNWVSIICGDGTGICFAGSSTIIADYGEFDTEGALLNSIGTIMLENGKYTYTEN